MLQLEDSLSSEASVSSISMDMDDPELDKKIRYAKWDLLPRKFMLCILSVLEPKACEHKGQVSSLHE